MAGGKCAPGRKGEPSHKCTSVDLEVKVRMVYKCESGKRISAVPPELGFMVSALNSIIKDAVHIKECARGMTVMKLVIVTKKLKVQ
jgi:hypothetical protein